VKLEKEKIALSLKAHLKFMESMGIHSIPSPGGGNQETLEDIRADIGDCRRCKLCAARKNIVFGVGNPHAELMFVGEGPGADEDDQGEPFVGRAGQLLTKIIAAMGMTRADVYINNIVMCRPPGNRVPEPDEVTSCKPFLMRRIEAINPRVIVCLGATAVQNLLEREVKITRIRGTWIDWNGRQLMPTFHPAFLLRNPAAKKEVWEDIKEVLKFLGRPIPRN
jgi:DNA polymerase